MWEDYTRVLNNEEEETVPETPFTTRIFDQGMCLYHCLEDKETEDRNGYFGFNIKYCPYFDQLDEEGKWMSTHLESVTTRRISVLDVGRETRFKMSDESVVHFISTEEYDGIMGYLSSEDNAQTLIIFFPDECVKKPKELKTPTYLYEEACKHMYRYDYIDRQRIEENCVHTHESKRYF